MAKKKWETVNIDDFFAPEYGPPAPVRLTQSPVRARTRHSTIKIPKPGPMTPAGTKPSSSKPLKYTKLDMKPSEAINDFEINITEATKGAAELPPRRKLMDRLAQARADGNPQEETRILRLLRNMDELKGLKRKPQKNSKQEKELRAKIRKDILDDPDLQKAQEITRGAIDDTFNLEVDKIYDVKRNIWYADSPNSFTAERIASGQSVRLGEIDTTHQTFKPISPAQREASEVAKREIQAMHERARALTSHQNSFLDELDTINSIMRPTTSSARRAKLPPMLKGMEKTGLPISIGRPKTQLEVMKAFPEVASPIDELTRVSIAEGRSELLRPNRQPFMDVDLAEHARRVSENRNKPILYNIQRLAREGNITHTEKADMMMDLLDKDFRKRLFSPRESTDQVSRISKIKVGESVLSDRRILDQQAKEASRQTSRQAAANAARQRMSVPNGIGNMDYDFLSRYAPKVNGNFVQQATIQSTEAIAEQTAERGAGRMTSRIAETLGQDTLRAASVIHSSKLGYAAIGAVAIAGVFGIGARERAKREFERQG